MPQAQEAEKMDLIALSAFIARWIDNLESPAALIKVVNSSMSEAEASRESWVNWVPALSETVDGLLTNSVKSVRDKYSSVNNDNVIECLNFILSQSYKQGSGWSTFVPNFFRSSLPSIARTPLAAIVVSDLLKRFFTDVIALIGSGSKNEPNKSLFSTDEIQRILQLKALCDRGEINPVSYPGQVVVMHDSINSAIARSQLSHHRLTSEP